MSYLYLVLGFVLLIKGADMFVDGSSSIAKRLKIPGIIVGLTIVAMGTSAPEAAVSISATMTGSNDMAVGNIVGSCIMNLMLIVGVCALIKPMNVDRSFLKADFPISVASAAVLFLICVGKSLKITRIEGIVIFALFIGYIVFTVLRALKYRKENSGEEDEIKVLSVPKTVIFTIVGAAAIVVGGELTVDAAKNIAQSLGVTEKLIGLTIVAFGTSLPELVTSIIASRKGESDLALGNVIGSNVFNILFILGMTAAIRPITVDMDAVYDSLILVAMSVMVFIFALTRKKIGRAEGSAMLISYIAYTAYIIMR
jgi:cation:H+ antiporter